MAQESLAPATEDWILVTDPPKFDLDSYIANYEGLTRLTRLVIIGTSSTYLRTDALRAAAAEAKRGKNVDRYMEVIQRLQEIDPDDPTAAPDLAWADGTAKRVKAETERLESELKGYKNNLIKESIRMGNEDLGAFYYEIGDFPSSLKAYNRMREYCTSPKHLAEMSLRLLLVAIAQENWMAVQTNIIKLKGLNLKPDDKTKIEAGLSPCYGLAHMALGQYSEAATQFLQSDPAFLTLEPIAGVQPNRQFLTANDVAVYGGLCALASMDRAQLQSKVLDNNDFRNFLELEPHIRRAISSFCNSKYTACLEILEAYRADYLLDLYLQKHVANIYTAIRRKSIVQYFRPFSCVSLAVMAAAFNTTEENMETELVEMIQDNKLDARIDLVGRMLLTTSTNQRGAVHAQALKMAEDHEWQLRLQLMKLTMQGAGLELKIPKQQQQQQTDGKGGGLRKSKFDFFSN